ncbi:MULTISPECIES: hypothetical protein [Prosthecobacter]|jgi:hypothetical protein|uniref:Lipoprotein n=2 Tax=Prosthecobacter TaxID=48463 RepID=A0A7W7YLV7_9BACT|nr:hypothetical protein [Prosthecobacter dejongeii]MBB5038603.1 hypothetical protein [Prosthecobacter dejongeii]
MKKLTLTFAAAALMMTGVSCSTPNTDSGGRRYHTSPIPIHNKTGISWTDTKAQTPSGPSGQVRYHHSPSPIASKTGLQASYVR